MKKSLMVITFILGLNIGMLFSSVQAVNRYEDVIGTRYEDVVEELSSKDIINGFPDGTFRPNENVTRAQFAKLVVEVCKLEQGSSTAVASFSDVDMDNWAYDYIYTAVANKIVVGYPDGTFRPDNDVTYEEIMTMIIRALGMEKEINTNDSDWSIGYMHAAEIAGLLKNMEYLDSSNTATRGETAIALRNMLTLLSSMEEGSKNESSNPNEVINDSNKNSDEDSAKDDGSNTGFKLSRNSLGNTTGVELNGNEYTFETTKSTADIDIFDYEDGVVVFYVKTKKSGEKYLTFKSGLTVEELRNADGNATDYVEAKKQDIVRFTNLGNTVINDSFIKSYKDYTFLEVEIEEDAEVEDENLVVGIGSTIKVDDVTSDIFEEGDRIIEDKPNEVIYIIRGLSERIAE